MAVDSIQMYESTVPIDRERLQGLTESIRLFGVLVPLLASPDLRLRDGRYRLLACRALGIETVDVRVLDGDEPLQEMAAIDVHLQRRELGRLELCLALKRRIDIYYDLHPEARPGSPEFMAMTRAGLPKSERTPGYCQDVAAKTGINERQVERLLKVAHGLSGTAAELLAPTKLAGKIGKLTAIADLPKPKQADVVKLLASAGGPKTVKKAWAIVRGEQPEPPRPLILNTHAGSGFSTIERAIAIALKRQGLDFTEFGIKIVETPGRPHLTKFTYPSYPGLDLTQVMSTVWQVTSEIGAVRAAWADTDYPEVEWSPGLTLAEIDTLPAGPIGMVFENPGSVLMSKAGRTIGRLPVRREAKGGTYCKPFGNEKSRDCFAIIDDAAQGCLRRLLNYAKCGQPCYSDAAGCAGCYAATSQFAAQKVNQDKGFDITVNGVLNDILAIHLPTDGSPVLNFKADVDGHQPCTMVRVDSESTDGSISIALGLLQSWADANPEMLFQTICSHVVRPSSAMMAWLAALNNVWVGHSVSAWFSEDELEARFRCIERFISYGINTVIWIATDKDWDNTPVLERALALVPADHIIETPIARGHSMQEPLLNVNPFGACRQARYDQADRRVTAISSEDGEIRYVVQLPDGTHEEPHGDIKAMCLGCRLKCGLAGLVAAGKLTLAGSVTDVAAESGDGVAASVPAPTPAAGRAGYELVNTSAISPATPHTCVDLFAGAGGLSLGFQMAGYQPLLAVEIDEHAAATYRANFPDTRVITDDIRKVTDQAILDALGGAAADALVGGSCCQGFSTSGNRDPNDPRNWLFEHFVHVAALLQPPFIVMENVKGLSTMPETDFLDLIGQALATAGYPDVAVGTLQAANYGVPQRRERMFVIANRRGLPNPFPLPLLGERQFVSVAQAIGDLAGLPADESTAQVWTHHSQRVTESIARLQPGESLYPSYGESWRRLYADQPAWTVKYNNGGPAIHPWLHRAISIREMARLQGFPDSFLLTGHMTSLGEQIGNAVPPPLAREVALAVLSALLGITDGTDAGQRPAAA